MNSSIATARGLRAHPYRLLLATALVALAAGLGLPRLAQAAAWHHGGPDALGPGMMMMGPRLLDRVNATPAQRYQIKQIMAAARKDLQPLHEQARRLHEQGMALFTQPTIDANAAEALRQQAQALHDQASRRMLQAMVDAGNVLTPQQRQLMATQMQQRQALMHQQRAERAALAGAKP